MMTPVQINIAVAESCGWTKIYWYDGDNSGSGYLVGLRDVRTFWTRIPNYCGSLDAIAEAEKTLTRDQGEMFYCFLMELVPADENHGPGGDGLDIMLPSSFTMVHAGPRERSIAFLQTKGRHPTPGE